MPMLLDSGGSQSVTQPSHFWPPVLKKPILRSQMDSKGQIKEINMVTLGRGTHPLTTPSLSLT